MVSDALLLQDVRHSWPTGCSDPKAWVKAVDAVEALLREARLVDEFGYLVVRSEPITFTPQVGFTVRGRPVTQGSMQAAVSKYGTPYVRQDHRSNLVDWRHAINDEARNAFAGKVAFTDAVSVSLQFTFPRPKGHYGTGRNAGVLKATAPEYPTGRIGDIDKLARAALDALKGVAYTDDAQVVSLYASKAYASEQAPEGVAVSVGGRS